jgi:hypothetical protein
VQRNLRAHRAGAQHRDRINLCHLSFLRPITGV